VPAFEYFVDNENVSLTANGRCSPCTGHVLDIISGQYPGTQLKDSRGILGYLIRALCRVNRDIAKPDEGYGMYSKHDNDETSHIANVYYRGSWVGMYKAKLVGDSSIVLQHGAISFPVGTALKLKFRQLAERKAIRKHLSGIVRNNSSNGMLLRLQLVA